MTARGTDWGLGALVALLIVTGLITLLAGGSGDAWVFAAHDALGVGIALLLIVKLRRVWSRVAVLARWDRRTIVGVVGIVLATAAIASGVSWASGVTPASSFLPAGLGRRSAGSRTTERGRSRASCTKLDLASPP